MVRQPSSPSRNKPDHLGDTIVKILILPGDDIGPEISAPNEAALTELNEKFSLGLELERREIGFTAYEKEGSTFSNETLEQCRASAAVILGPVGTYKYPPKEEGGVSPSATLRKELDLYANVRPSRTRPAIPSVIKQMDLVFMRENTEGFYADRNMFQGSGEFMPTEDVALSVRKITRKGSLRIARQAFELAAKRRNKVTAVHKENVLKVTEGLFMSAVREVSAEYPGIELESLIVDAAAAHLVRRPADFDVIVTTNMYGDILSDEAAELSGGLGLGAAINVGDEHGMAQAAHGSAPDIAGRGVANPTALMVSTAMLLDWLGRKHNRTDLCAAGEHYEKAVDATLSDPLNHTPDLGGKRTTGEFGEAVIAAIRT
jgi:isocitrate/isopropylmalate dehydrogenase